MIYYKRKNFFKKIINNIAKRRDNKKVSSFKVLKNFLAIIFSLLLILYLSYLFLLPVLLNEKNTEKIVNDYLIKNSKLILDVENLRVNPDYKFDIELRADNIKLKYSKDKDFLSIQKPVIDINLLTLFFGYIDLNKIKTNKITLNVNFTKNKKYNCFDYFDFDILDLKKHNSNFQIRNVRILSDEFNLNLYDENIQKMFNIKTSKIKFLSNDIKKPFYIITKGQIGTKENKILDFNLNLEFLIKPNELSLLKTKIHNLNYNPLIYAYKYKFSAKSDIDLKIKTIDKKHNITGKIQLSDYSFTVDDLKLPKNNILLLFKGDKIISDCNFNFIKNQFVNINSSLSFAKNKFIEAKITSNEINLKELNSITDAFYKILNLKFDMDDIELSGLIKTDLYIKSDFNTINSKGYLNIKNAKIKNKKLKITLDNINSNINFENNKINISDTYCFIDKAKFYLNGFIDDKTNLNLKLHSDLLNIAHVINLCQTMPVLSKILPLVNDYKFNNGFLLINADIKGNLKKPVINSISRLENLKVYIKKNKADFTSDEILIFIKPKEDEISDISLTLKNSSVKKDNILIKIPDSKLKITENNIEINNTNFESDILKGHLEGIINNFKNNPSAVFKLKGNILKQNKFISFKNIEPLISLDTTISDNKIIINNCILSEKEKKLASISGGIDKFLSDNPILNNLKIQIEDKLPIKVQDFSFDVKGNVILNGSYKKPDLNGNLNLYNITKKDLNLSIKDMLLNIKDSNAYINIINAKIFDFNFDLAGNIKYEKDKITAQNLTVNSPYINTSAFDKFLKTKSNMNLPFEINELKGNILTVEADDILLNSVQFRGNLKNNLLTISSFSTELFEGSASGVLKYDFNNQKMSSGIILKDINVRQISRQIKEFSIAASGRLNAIIDADFQGFNLNDIFKTLDGYIRFDIKNGELAQFAKFERFLQAGNILSESILKLSLNSAISAISKKNTGYFEKIEGIIRIKNSNAQIQNIKTTGTNMSLYVTGSFNLITKYCDIKVLGKIPYSFVNIMGSFGNFSTDRIVEKMPDDAKNVIKSITSSPFEKILSVKIPDEELKNIPPLAVQNVPYREFMVIIQGNAQNISSVKLFKWNSKEE